MRPPYRAALVVTLLVLAGYVFSLAPSVTFWDAGEFIAAMKGLGIPHPPGTPLFVLMGHVWAGLIPFGEYAWRTNLLSATFSAGAAGFWFLVVHEALLRAIPGDDRAANRLRIVGAGASALLAAFTFTNWQNSNETEVYAVASFIVGAIAWSCLRWRAARGTDRARRALLMIAYLLGLSIANHLLALLAGPAVIAFLVAELRLHPAASAEERRGEWARAAVFAGLWALLLGVGLGSPGIAVVGGLAFLAASVFALRAGALGFALVAVAIALVGVTPYLFLFLRSAQHPVLNEAAPSTWDALLAVIQRAQYPVRTPFDDPTHLHGPDNPGRTLSIIGLQLLNYVQYFDWQWAKSLAVQFAGVPLRVIATITFFSLGLYGAGVHRRADRTGWWLIFTLWLVTGLGLVGYMNFKPGYSLGYQLFPSSGQHEVRERDYFFVLSFVTWGLWAGMGLTSLVRQAGEAGRGLRQGAFLAFALVLVPPVLNFREADRAHGPDTHLPGDFAYDLLNSAPPYGILFTYGDNDTFPLWWAQEVAGIRQDVRVVCLALSRTDWYMRQLRENPERPFARDRAPAIWRDSSAEQPTWPLHSMTDEEIAAAVPQYLPRAVPLRFGPYRAVLDSGTVLYPEDFAVIRIVQQNFGRRPVVWSLTTAGKYFGLDGLIVQNGLGLELQTSPPDTTSPALDFNGMFGVPLDVPTTRRLAMETYRYGGLLESPPSTLESTAAGIAQTLTVPLTQLALAARSRHDYQGAIGYLERAAAITPSASVTQLLASLRAEAAKPAATDSGGAPAKGSARGVETPRP